MLTELEARVVETLVTLRPLGAISATTAVNAGSIVRAVFGVRFSDINAMVKKGVLKEVVHPTADDMGEEYCYYVSAAAREERSVSK